MSATEAARTQARPRMRAAGATHPGRIRTSNEDRLHVDVERGIFVVADGVGGHAAGEVAAAIAVDVIAQRLERPLWSPERRVREAVALANNEILTQAQASPDRAGMTCVLTLALVGDDRVTVGHVGDTRLYALSPHAMVKLTHDHSPVGQREDAGEITELDAMRHPRRNEVFRDVGSSLHQPDDPDFIEVIEAPFDERSALLICSDGLSDMIPAATIEGLVRRHAGTPDQVVEALIGAANDAGGKDNVTAVYVEGAQFAQASVAAPPPAERALPGRPDESETAGNRWATRLTWLCVGALAGLAAGLGLAWTLSLDTPLPRRPLVVGSDSTGDRGRFGSIGDAMRAAEAGDVVMVEPGEYAEAVVMTDGVDLEARVPGTVTLVAPSDQEDWVSVTTSGRLGNRIRGVHILGRADAPIGTGLHLSGHAIHVSDVSVAGTVLVGAAVENDGDVSIAASRFLNLPGVGVRVNAGARPVIRDNIFLHNAGPGPGAAARSGGTASPRSAGRGTGSHPAMPVAAEIASGAMPSFTGNVFIGYPAVLDAPTGEGERLLQGNTVVARPPAAPAGRRTP
jgi:serine/threonine protein phosphatase PrpC